MPYVNPRTPREERNGAARDRTVAGPHRQLRLPSPRPGTGASGVVDPAVAEPVLGGCALGRGLDLDPGDAPPRRPHRRPRRGQGGDGRRAVGRAPTRADPGPRRAGRRGRRGGLRHARGPGARDPGPHERPRQLLVPGSRGAVLRRHAVRARLRPPVRGRRPDDVALARQARGPARRDPRLLRPRVHAEQRPLRAHRRPRQRGAASPRRRDRRGPGARAADDPHHDRRGEGDQPLPPRRRPDDPASTRPRGAPDAEVFAEVRRRKDRA